MRPSVSAEPLLSLVSIDLTESPNGQHHRQKQLNLPDNNRWRPRIEAKALPEKVIAGEALNVSKRALN